MQSNPESRRRLRIATYFRSCLDRMDISARAALKECRIDTRCIGQLDLKVIPQLKVLEPIGSLIEGKVKSGERIARPTRSRTLLDARR